MVGRRESERVKKLIPTSFANNDADLIQWFAQLLNAIERPRAGRPNCRHTVAHDWPYWPPPLPSLALANWLQWVSEWVGGVFENKIVQCWQFTLHQQRRTMSPRGRYNKIGAIYSIILLTEPEAHRSRAGGKEKGSEWSGLQKWSSSGTQCGKVSRWLSLGWKIVKISLTGNGTAIALSYDLSYELKGSCFFCFNML